MKSVLSTHNELCVLGQQWHTVLGVIYTLPFLHGVIISFQSKFGNGNKKVAQIMDVIVLDKNIYQKGNEKYQVCHIDVIVLSCACMLVYLQAKVIQWLKAAFYPCHHCLASCYQSYPRRVSKWFLVGSVTRSQIKCVPSTTNQ